MSGLLSIEVCYALPDGQTLIPVELPEGARVVDLRAALAAQSANLRALAPCLLVAVGTDYADDRLLLLPFLQGY